MKNFLICIFSIALLVGSVSAYCACIEPRGPCGCSDDSYYDNEKNVSVWVGVKEQSDPRFIYSTDRPFGNDDIDVFENSRDEFFSYEDTLEIKMQKACVNENIEVKAIYRNKPVEAVRIKLYSHAGGRELVSEAYSDANGNAIFSPLQLGKYDFVAILEGYNRGQEIFSVEACESPRGAAVPDIMNKRAVARARAASLPAEEKAGIIESGAVRFEPEEDAGDAKSGFGADKAGGKVSKKEVGIIEFILSIFG